MQFGACLALMVLSCFVSGSPYKAREAYDRLYNASETEYLNVDKDLFFLRLRQFVQTAGTEHARKSVSGMCGHCLWPPELHDGSIYNGEVNPQGVAEHEVTENEKRCLPRCRSDEKFVFHHATVVIETSCYKLHRLDTCLFVLRSFNNFERIHHRLAIRKWLQDAGWILDQGIDVILQQRLGE
jgi:hypothetical protein